MANGGIPNCEVYAARLADPHLDTTLKNTIIRELRDSFDFYQASNYDHFLSVIFPVFKDLLTKQQPAFVENAAEQKLRSTILEILHRFPMNEHLKPYVDDIIVICLKLIRSENEDNAVLCLKILVELHRAYKGVLEEHIQAFFTLVQEMYRNVGKILRDSFEAGETPGGPVTPFSNPFASPRPMSPSSMDTPDASNRPLARSLWSFKVLAECPMIVVMLCQSKKFPVEQAAEFIPLVVDTLKLRIRQQQESADLAAKQHRVFVGMCPQVKNKALYHEFINAQAKTFSFLAYLQRALPAKLRIYQDSLPEIVIHLLQDCPADATSVRKELLMGLRHILATDLRTAFVPEIETLLNERILVGDGVTSRETLRPLAFSTLADLVHHVRTDLSPQQLSMAVGVYAVHLHDATLASGIQSMCAKLLLNLIDCADRIPDKQVGRRLLIQILSTFTRKLQSLVAQFPRVRDQYRLKMKQLPQTPSPSSNDRDPITFTSGTVYEQYLPIALSTLEAQGDIIKDTRFLIKSLVSGIKNAVFNLKHCNPPPPPSETNLQEYNAVARGFPPEEVAIFQNLFRAGINCFDYYGIPQAAEELNASEGAASPINPTIPPDGPTLAAHHREFTAKYGAVTKEEKELLEHFASVFIYIDPAIFQEVFKTQMPHLFARTLIHISLLTVPQFFLASDAVSQSFASIALEFLMDALDELGGTDLLKTSVMVQLFKLVFMAVTLFPNANEIVLKPHVAKIITSCLKLSGKAYNPADFFHLLRALFRSIGGGRFETLYKEVLPLLRMLLENLNALLNTTHERHMRDLFVEICLTVPVRLSVLLPYLALLMRPLVLALEPGSELVGQGLRTLELCIDNLTQEFLDPIMAPVINDIMWALWKHLQPDPYDQSLSHTTVRILGKLGGRNRRMFKSFPQLNYLNPAQKVLHMNIYFHGIDHPHPLPLDECLAMATRVLENPAVDFFYKEKALALVTGQLALLVDTQGFTAHYLQRLRQWFRKVAAAHISAASTGGGAGPGPVPVSSSQGADHPLPHMMPSFELRRHTPAAPDDVLATVIHAVFRAASVPGLRDRAIALIEQVVRYFAVWHTTQFCAQLSESDYSASVPGPSPPVATAGPAETVASQSAPVLVESLVRAFASESPEMNQLGEQALHLFYRTVCMLLGEDHSVTTELSLLQPSPRSPKIPALSRLSTEDEPAPATPQLAITSPTPAAGDAPTSPELPTSPLADSHHAALVAQLPIFHDLAVRFTGCCYLEDRSQKLGGCRGIRLLSMQLQLGRSWLLEHVVDFVKGLLYILKDSTITEFYSRAAHIDFTTDTLYSILWQCWHKRRSPCPHPPTGATQEGQSTTNTPVPNWSNPLAQMEVDQTADGPVKQEPGSDGVTVPATTPMDTAPSGPSAASNTSPGLPAESSPSTSIKPEGTLSNSSPTKLEPRSIPGVSTPGAVSSPTLVDMSTQASAVVDPSSSTPKPTTAGPDDESAAPDLLQIKFNSIVDLLIIELSNSNANVRRTAQGSFELLSVETGISITDILTPLREKLLRPIFAKPLRALSLNMQIGNTDAITFCLSLEPPLLAINEPLLRLLNEALALADAEDQALVNTGAQVRGPNYVVNFRLVCLKLLSTAMTNAEFLTTRQNPMQGRIISVFFKSLYSKSPDIVEVANKGLKFVLTHIPKLPKELLQTGLRPILMSLSDHRRLSVHGMEALARMLRLLTSYFKVEIGRKVLDHLQNLANPTMLAEASTKPLQDIEEIKVAVAMLNIFHLLPPSANVFLAELVNTTLQMESSLRRDKSSPFRAPLLAYLTNYASESVVFFLNHMASAPHALLFANMLKLDTTLTLTKALMTHQEEIGALLQLQEPVIRAVATSAKSTPAPTTNVGGGETPTAKPSPSVDTPSNNAAYTSTPSQPPVGDTPTVPATGAGASDGVSDAKAQPASRTPEERLAMAFHTVHLLNIMVDHQPQWLADHPDLVAHIATFAHSELIRTRLAGAMEHPFTVAELRDFELLVDLLMAILKFQPTATILVWPILRFGGSDGPFDTVALRRFFWETVCLQFSTDAKRQILHQFLDNLMDSSVSTELKVRALRFVVNPMVLASLRSPDVSPVLDEAMVRQIGTQLWEQMSGKHSPDMRAWLNDYLIIEILQFTGLIVEYAPQLMENKKAVILFSWGFIKIEDIITKHSTYVLLARFINAFETPVKICSQIYVALLRAHQSEVRNLVRQALDCMTPILPQRLPTSTPAQGAGSAGSAASDAALPAWVRWIKKILVEEGHSVTQMVNIYQLLIRHHEMFFDSREQFFPHVVSALTKLGLMQSFTPETRALTIDLAELVLKWEQTRLTKTTAAGESDPAAASSSGAMDIDAATANEATSPKPSPTFGATRKRSASSATASSMAAPEGHGLGARSGNRNSAAASLALYMPPLYLRESVVNYLVRFVCFTNETSNRVVLIPRALRILKELLSPPLWVDIQVKLSHFERCLLHVVMNEAILTTVCNNLEVLRIVVDRADSKWLLEHLRPLYSLLEKSLQFDNPAVVHALFPILKRIYDIIYPTPAADFVRPSSPSPRVSVLASTVPAKVGESAAVPTGDLDGIRPAPAGDDDEDNSDLAHFHSAMDTFINEGLQNTTNLFGVLKALKARSQAHPQGLDVFIPGLVKLVQKLTRDHIDHPQTSALSTSGTATPSATSKTPAVGGAGPNIFLSDSSTPTAQQASATAAPTPATAESSPPDSPLNLLIITLNLLKMRISHLGDQRRWYLTALVTLIENSQSIQLLSTILAIIAEWVLDPESLFPTIKEKANLLVTMMSVEKRQNAHLTEDYLKLVEKIYAEPSFARSELTYRLEQAFLLGTCFPNPVLRSRFYHIFNHSISPSLPLRLNYVIHIQNWESLGGYFWIQQALAILLGSIAGHHKLETLSHSTKTAPIAALAPWLDTDMDTDGPCPSITSTVTPPGGSDTSDRLFTQLADSLTTFVDTICQYRLSDMMAPLMQLIYLDPQLSATLWKDLFPLCWSCLTSKQRHDLTKSLIHLLAKPYHKLQENARPNVVQTLLDAVLQCRPMPQLSPQLVKFLGKHFNAWHSALLILERSITEIPPENPEEMEEDKVLGSTLDGLAELYWHLDEQDYFFGLWRRRASYMETNTALSYEQADVWDQAQAMYEKAQTRARKGGLPFSESEYCLWEDHWIRATQKLQQWDILIDLAKHDDNSDLQTECAWRLWDWSKDTAQVAGLLERGTDEASPRHKMYQTFLILIEAQKDKSRLEDFNQSWIQCLQLSLKKWYALPTEIGPANIPHLHLFQLFVELQDAQNMYASLETTTTSNIEVKSHDLKTNLQTWRERLPNSWDDIQLWSDIVAWRQHTFTAINKTYLPMVPALTQQQANGQTNVAATSFAYRGYHETAWIINRFARVARQHKLLDVCVDSLNKIYTLPNIEIQEAFLKLKEQAQCYYENPAEWTTGLDVINNTNLMYFNGAQKAEFFSLKGMFLAKLDLHDQAKLAFSEAIQSDMSSGKAWAAWGQFNDTLFKDNPTDVNWGTHALSCYLHAAGIFKNAQSRRFIARILWLLTLDDSTGSMAKVFESYKGEMPIQFWNAFIPQLLTGLSQREAPLCRQMLILIAKSYPQALHYHVRATREELLLLKRQISAPPAGDASSGGDANKALQSWDHVEEIMRVLKTAFPLSGTSIEMMIEQIYTRLKPTNDEEVYRLLVALHSDGVQQLNLRLSHGIANMHLNTATEANLKKFAYTVVPAFVREEFLRDFLQEKLTFDPYIVKLRRWRDRFEKMVDRRPKRQPLENFSHYLVEFESKKYDEIEVPGQYQLLKNESELVRIDRFIPEVVMVRGFGYCYRRISIRGQNGVVYPFMVQQPLPRHSKREERVYQLFRFFDTLLDDQRESRKRDLSFTLPVIVPVAPLLRIVQDDPSYFTLQEMYESYCQRHNFSRDDATSYYTTALGQLDDTKRQKSEFLNLKMDIIDHITTNFAPSTMLRDYIMHSTPSYADYWLFRKQFTGQLAAATFMTYIISAGHRYPHKFSVSRATGNVWSMEMVPTWTSQSPIFTNVESVPFRLTPNLQTFMQPIGIEGCFTGSLVAIARSLTEPENEMSDFLSVFVRDELYNWQTTHQKTFDLPALRDKVNQNINTIIIKTEALSCRNDREKGAEKNIPACQTVLDLISHATNPEILARMDCIWMPWI
ncbi:transcription-associated protein 1 [Dimargaris cristalligena]|nr:transcription-associated protein 1 [Dimargaris cristalligena]